MKYQYTNYLTYIDKKNQKVTSILVYLQEEMEIIKKQLLKSYN